jgi:hypothetical protein
VFGKRHQRWIRADISLHPIHNEKKTDNAIESSDLETLYIRDGEVLLIRMLRLTAVNNPSPLFCFVLNHTRIGGLEGLCRTKESHIPSSWSMPPFEGPLSPAPTTAVQKGTKKEKEVIIQTSPNKESEWCLDGILVIPFAFPQSPEPPPSAFHRETTTPHSSALPGPAASP